MKYILIIITALLLIRCGNLKETKSRNYYLSHKDKLAELCSGEFPSNPIYIKGDPIVTRDTILQPVEIEVDCDTVKGKIKVREVVKYVNTHTHSTDTIKTPDLATETKLRNEINTLRADNIVLLKHNEAKNWTIGIMGLALAGLLILIFKR